MTLNKDNSEYSCSTPIVVAEKSVERNLPEGPIDITKSVAKEDKHLVQPAGVGAAVLGLIFGGPIVSALLGFSAAYAVRKKTQTGNAARALGELTLSVQEKTAEIEEKNHFIEKATKSLNNFCNDEREKSIAFKTRAFLVSTWLSVSNYTKENQLLERGVEGTGKGIEFIAKSIKNLQGKSANGEEDVVFISRDEPTSWDGDHPKFVELKEVTTH